MLDPISLMFMPLLMIFLLPLLFLMSPLFDAAAGGCLVLLVVLTNLARPFTPDFSDSASALNARLRAVRALEIPELLARASNTWAVSLPLKAVDGFSILRLTPEGRTEVMLGRSRMDGLTLADLAPTAESEATPPVLIVDLNSLPADVLEAGVISSPGPLVVHGAPGSRAITLRSAAFVIYCDDAVPTAAVKIDAPLVVLAHAGQRAKVTVPDSARVVDFPDLVEFAGNTMSALLRGEIEPGDIHARAEARFPRQGCDDKLTGRWDLFDRVGQFLRGA